MSCVYLIYTYGLGSFKFAQVSNGKTVTTPKKKHKYIQVYTNIYTRYASRPVRLGAGPGCRRLAAAWYFVSIWYILYNFADI